MNARIAALLAGAGIIVLILISHVGRATNHPAGGSDHLPAPVTSVVRTDLGELKWVAATATAYTQTELAGRDVYLRSGCAYCHSQYVRPVTAEMPAWGPVSADPRRWGPPVEPNEYAYDGPRLPASRLFGVGIRIAPDLSREGLKYSD